MRIVLRVVGIVVLAILALLVLGGLGIGMMGFGRFGRLGLIGPFGMRRFGGGFGFINPLGWIVPLLVCLVAVAIIAFLLTWLARSSSRPATLVPAGETPLSIAQARYARGEITKEQYEQMKRDLG